MLKIATCQMTSGIDLSKNLEEAESFIRKAAMEGCNLNLSAGNFCIDAQRTAGRISFS